MWGLELSLRGWAKGGEGLPGQRPGGGTEGDGWVYLSRVLKDSNRKGEWEDVQKREEKEDAQADVGEGMGEWIHVFGCEKVRNWIEHLIAWPVIDESL